MSNAEFLNYCIRTSLLARRALKGIPPEKYLINIYHAQEGTELFALKNMVNIHRDFWSLRFKSYQYALISEVFDVKHFISQRRLLDMR